MFVTEFPKTTWKAEVSEKLARVVGSADQSLALTTSANGLVGSAAGTRLGRKRWIMDREV